MISAVLGNTISRLCGISSSFTGKLICELAISKLCRSAQIPLFVLSSSLSLSQLPEPNALIAIRLMRTGFLQSIIVLLVGKHLFLPYTLQKLHPHPPDNLCSVLRLRTRIRRPDMAGDRTTVDIGISPSAYP
ncbi:hypothetical protein Salat_2484800 [Sesamum alatum]|uniref:Uncharacterized protein n=1 Tax=Sesamum alatum TaxID=300844 RepID=A0AAE1XSA0_9LAMI|nr:hypothetical protein Salat_2484800 [Sesamum alatum]